MESKTIHIFMVDDHPSMIEGYKSILSYNDLGYKIEVTSAFDCKSAYNRMMQSDDIYEFDMVFLDLSLPPYEEKNINSGQDLALIARKKYPFAKILMLTSHAEAFILYEIQSTIDPDGLLVKSDFTADEFLKAFEVIVNKEKYISKTVKESIQEMLEVKNKVFLDENNRTIISLLSQGVLSKNLPNYINLAQSSIDKRKAQIKDYFCVKGGTDEDIVREAKKHGFV
ncbi:MAG: response regulator transcription factor [Flavobacterium sp.]|nr:response regulator transcription factor [Flavobacterium sp.]